MFGLTTIVAASVSFIIVFLVLIMELYKFGPVDGHGDVTCFPCEEKVEIFMTNEELELEAMETNR